MKVLSLFDGVSCARLALERAGVKVSLYISSEIDKYAIKVTQTNRPNTFQIGDVKEFSFESRNPIDLLIGGSPCQDLSIAKKDRQGLEGSRSSLFYEYVRILNEVKPRYFVLENVASMRKADQDTITKELFGIEPVMINASLISAQNRKRLFWVGKLVNGSYEQVQIEQPEDRQIYLKDILECGEVDRLKSYCIDANYHKGANWEQYKSKGRRQLVVTGCASRTWPRIKVSGQTRSKRLEARTDGKANNLTSVQTDSMVISNKQIRKLTPIECERLQGMPFVEKYAIIKLCTENQNKNVNAELINHKLQKPAGIAEASNQNENVQFAKLYSSINCLQTKKLAQSSVVIYCEENKIQIYNQGELIFPAKNVESQDCCHLAKLNETSIAQLSVFIMQILEQIIDFGKEELHQKGQCLTQVQSGKSVVKLFGNEITQLAKDAKIDLTTDNKLLKFITSDLFTQESNEQKLKILFSYVANAIFGYTQSQIQNPTTFCLITKNGWTNPTGDISNTQRYKMCGNAFNVDVVAHIIKQLNLCTPK